MADKFMTAICETFEDRRVTTDSILLSLLILVPVIIIYGAA
jgi:hypothetical protein